MTSYSKVSMIGYVVREPEQRTLANGDSVAVFTVPYTERKRDHQGSWSDGTTAWYRVSAFGTMAERAVEQLHKGTRVYVEGTLAPRTYTDRAGQTQVSLDVRCRELRVLDKRQNPPTAPLPDESAAEVTSDADTDDWPF